MKIYIPNSGVDALLVRRLGRYPVWVILACCLAFLCVSYALKDYLGWWPMIVFVLGGIGAGGAAYASPDQSGRIETREAQLEESAPQIMSEWDYRPKGMPRRNAPLTPDIVTETEGTHGSGTSPSAPGQSADVWFSFAAQDPMSEETTTKAPV